MNSFGHLIVSISKSILRIGSCVFAYGMNNVKYLAIGFLVAEILGIIEELVDKRE